MLRTLAEGKEATMARLVTGERLRQAVQSQTFIKNGIPDNAEGVKYDFRLSGHILKAGFGRPIDAARLSESEKRDLVIAPGEMVFALTEERLALPDNMIAELSPKRKMSHAGVLVIGGFCIDPKYEGPLLIGLFNFSSTNFPLDPGRKVIAATFYELEAEERGEFPQPAEFEAFPVELVQVMQKYQPSSVPALAEVVNKLRTDVERLTADLVSHEEWYRRFQESLDKHDGQIGELISGVNTQKEALTAEQGSRARGEDTLTKALNEIRQTLSWLKGAAWIVAAFIGLVLAGVVAPLAYSYLSKRFGL